MSQTVTQTAQVGKRDRFQVDLLEGPILRSLLLFAAPMLLSNLFQQFYNMADTMIVGIYLGDASLAAMGACQAIYDLLVGFALGIGSGLAVVTARCFGSGDYLRMKRAIALSIWVGLITTTAVTVGGRLLLRPLLELLNTPAEIIDESYRYISTIVSCTLVMFAYNLCSGLLRSVGNSVMPLVFLILSSILNVGLDILFISRLGMGIRGAAVATVLAQGVSVVLCFVYIWKKARILVPQREDFRFDRALWNELWGQGISMGLTGSIVAIGSVILQYGINGFGTLIIAGHTAARKLYMFMSMPIGTLSMAIPTFVSQNRGANRRDRILQAMKCGYVMYFVFAGIIAVILMVGARPLVQLFSGSTEPVLLDNASLYLQVTAPFFFVLGVLLQLRGSLQGIGEKVMPLVSSVIELVGKILFTVFLIPRFGYLAVIFCEPIIWCFMAAQLLYSFYTNPYIRGKNWTRDTITYE